MKYKLYPMGKQVKCSVDKVANSIQNQSEEKKTVSVFSSKSKYYTIRISNTHCRECNKWDL